MKQIETEIRRKIYQKISSLTKTEGGGNMTLNCNQKISNKKITEAFKQQLIKNIQVDGSFLVKKTADNRRHLRECNIDFKEMTESVRSTLKINSNDYHNVFNYPVINNEGKKICIYKGESCYYLFSLNNNEKLYNLARFLLKKPSGNNSKNIKRDYQADLAGYKKTFCFYGNISVGRK
ncbi:MAG: hypothetical protein D3903_12080 [Candidatus Electrothrix sp. GM3_4]|nr:hypothetical protein [Candidatus Electrothrix sp. GM3_4]